MKNLALENQELIHLENIIFDVSTNKPLCCQGNIVAQEGYYRHNDPCMMFYLKNNGRFFIRIWAEHMNSSLECRKLSREGKIFVSASRIEGGKILHLPLYGWFQSDDYEGIWGKILES